MFRRLAAFSLLVGLCIAPAFPLAPHQSVAAAPDVRADAPFVKLPAEKKARPDRYFAIHADTNCKSLKWVIPDGLEQPDPDIIPPKPNCVILITSSANAEFTVKCYGALGDAVSEIASCTVVVGTPPAPPGPGPQPPGPGPGPQPPVPIPVAGLHMLIVLDKGATLPAGQADAVSAGDVRAYLNAHCPAGSDGTKSWRIWWNTTDASKEDLIWQNAKKLADGKALPYIIVSNGKTGEAGPLPKDKDGLMALLQKYGGQ